MHPVKLSFATKVLFILFNCFLLHSQTTQGLITGSVVDEVNLNVIAGANVVLSNSNEVMSRIKTETDES